MINHHPLTSDAFNGSLSVEITIGIIVLLGLFIGVRFGHRFPSMKKWWQRCLLGIAISLSAFVLLYVGLYVYEIFNF